MKKPQNLEELASIVNQEGKQVLIFTADWCGDCQYLYPYLPEIEAAYPDLTFAQVDRDEFLLLAKEWDIYGIPSFLVLENGREIGRFVNRNRKTKKEIQDFLETV